MRSLNVRDDVLQLVAQLGIERAERLVEQEDRRIGRQGSGDHDALRLATRQLGREAIVETVQLDEVDHLRDTLLDLGLRHLAQLETPGDVLAHRVVREHRRPLEDVTHASLVGWRPGRVVVAEPDPAAVRDLEARDHPQDRRLARPRRSEQDHELAGGDVEADLVNGHDRPEALGQMLDPKARAGHDSAQTIRPRKRLRAMM